MPFGPDKHSHLVLTQRLALLSILVPEYDDGLAFFVGKLGWKLHEDTELGHGKRWVRVAPLGAETQFLIAKAVGPQRDFIGKQGGGRVWLFLQTDDFAKDYAQMKEVGVTFEEAPRHEPYGTVAMFQDPFGNRWDLIQFTKPLTSALEPEN